MKMASDSTGYSIVTGLVEVEYGILSITNLNVKDMII
jgi:hypothetical protein